MLTTSNSRWRSYGVPCTIAFNFPIDLQIFKIKMSIKQDTMNEVKIQDITQSMCYWVSMVLEFKKNKNPIL